MPATTATSGRPKPNRPFAITLCTVKLSSARAQAATEFLDHIYVRVSPLRYLSADCTFKKVKKEGVLCQQSCKFQEVLNG